MATNVSNTLHRAALGAAALVLATATVLALPASAQSQEPVKQRIEIGDNGFNNQPDYTLEVEQGQLVELTFVFAQAIALGDNHVVVLRGLGLETNEINYYNREATLKFVADKPGTFELGCDLECEIHASLNKAHLKVRSAAGGASGAAGASLVATTLTAYPSAWDVEGGSVKLSASLRDADGTPVSKAPLRFLVDTEFGGVKGQMEVGSAKTNASGTASVTYKPTFAGIQRVTVRFDGMGLYRETEQALQVQVRGFEPGYSVAPRGLEGVSDRVPLVIFTILGGIWATFAYVLSQVFLISRSRAAGRLQSADS